jgi:predicted amidophosphoribosyltransferase
MTEAQARLSPAERRQNVSGAFVSEPIAGKTILLIDDVVTTGATLLECRAALRKAGAKEVIGFCLARGGDDESEKQKKR